MGVGLTAWADEVDARSGRERPLTQTSRALALSQQAERDASQERAQAEAVLRAAERTLKD